MLTNYSVPLTNLVKEFNLESLNIPENIEKIQVKSIDVTRPSLQLAGFTDVFNDTRIQVMGKTEISYLEKLDPELARSRCDSYFKLKPKATIIANNLSIPDYVLETAVNNGAPLFRSKDDTCEFIAALISQLSQELAPRITRHGVLVELYGEGVFIIGESGIGKSEVAIALMSRGHRLIADDAVEIRRINSRTLIGSSPENIRHFMEIRGVGIINARQLYGMSAVNTSQSIDMIVKFEYWDDEKMYDRFGNNNELYKIMDVKVPIITIPVKPGRNLAVIVEAAAMNQRLKKMGYNPTEELLKNLNMFDELGNNEENIISDTGWGSDK